MKLLHVLKESLEEVQRMQDQKEAALASAQKYENLYKEMCTRNAGLIEENEKLQDRVTYLEEEKEKLQSELSNIKDNAPDSFERDLGD